jgi:formylmethanofuran dehydrogenase subunit E
MKIGPYSFEEFLALVQSFHGNPAPGVVLGGIMVEAAKSRLPEDILFDAVAETRTCLPDAIQLLTPCTIGNGWLKVLDLGRFALSLYDKYQGEGIRVYLDPAKVKDFSEIANWYLKLTPKREQDKDLLLAQIQEAGADILNWQRVVLRPQYLGKKSRGGMTVCPLCREAYPAQDGGICRACQGEAPYQDPDPAGEVMQTCVPSLAAVPLEEALGKHLLHDMTQIVPGKSKGPIFKKDQVLSVGDLCRLQQMGRHHLYVAEKNPVGQDWVHEDEAALAFAMAMAGEGVVFATPPREGKISLTAARDGLFTADEERLQVFNLVPGVMCACRHNHTVVSLCICPSATFTRP